MPGPPPPPPGTEPVRNGDASTEQQRSTPDNLLSVLRGLPNDLRREGKLSPSPDKNKKEILLKMDIKCKYQCQMHRLAQDYFSHRDYNRHFLPITILTVLSATLAFVGSSGLFTSNDVKEILSLTVGFCSVVSVAFQTCANRSKYAVKSNMHKQAALGMKKISDNITFNQIDPESGLLSDRSSPTNPASTAAPTAASAPLDSKTDGDGGAQHSDEDPMGRAASMSEKVEGYRMVYTQVLESCDSTIPTKIVEAFDLMDTKMATLFILKETNARIETHLCLPNGKTIMLAAAYNELACVISSTRGWPRVMIKPNKVVDKAFETLQNTYLKCDTPTATKGGSA